MATLHLFYPENDLALADNTANYTAPRAAVDMRTAGEQLPLWYGNPGDVVFTTGTNNAWFEAVIKAFDLKTDLWQGQHIDAVKPWGWSPAVKRLFERLGVDPSILPTDAYIERVRALSHRSLAARLARHLHTEMPDHTAEPAIETDDIQQVADFITSNGRTLIKLPWSGSGRGIIDSDLVPDPEFSRRTSGSINRQGSVMLERYYADHYDFALLFDMNDGVAQFKGYSLFYTDNRGMYLGNIVAEEAILVDELSKHLDINILSVVVQMTADFLTSRIGNDYNGPLGVDMMAIDNGRRLAIAEINLRNTMGHVAHALATYVAPGLTARYTVLPNDGSAVNLPHPDNVHNNRLIQGKIDLTPADRRFRFQLLMERRF